MINRTLPATFVLALCAPLLAQKGPSPEQRQAIEFQRSQVWSDFVEQNGDGWMLDFHPATGTPNAICGPGIPLADWRESSRNEARRHGTILLRDHANLLGLGTSEFREAISGRMGKTWSIVYDQYFRGLEVIDGRADIRIHEVGRVAMLGSMAFQIPADFGTVPTLLPQTATAIAWQSLNRNPTSIREPNGTTEPRLVIWGDTHAKSLVTPVLAWEVRVDNVDKNGGQAGRFFIDAHKGDVLHFRTSRYECAAPAATAAAATAAAPASSATTANAPIVTKTFDTFAPPQPGVWTNTTVTLQGFTRTGLTANAFPVVYPLEGIEIAINGTTYTTNAQGKVTVNITGLATISMNGLRGPRYQSITGLSAPTVGGILLAGQNQNWLFGNIVGADEEVAHPTTDYWIQKANAYCRNIFGNSPQMNATDDIRAIVNSLAIPACSAVYNDNENRMTFAIGLGNCLNSAFSTVILHEWGHGLDDRFGGITNNEGLGEGWSDIIATYVGNTAYVGENWNGPGAFASSGWNLEQYPNITPSTGVHEAGHVFMGFAWKFRETLILNFPWAHATSVADDIVIGSMIADAQSQPDAVREIFLADDDDGNLSNGTPHRPYLISACNMHALPYPSPPANDQCTGAVALSAGVNGPFNNSYAGSYGNSWACANSSNNKGLWFSYTTNTPVALDISTCGHASFDTVMELWGGTCSSATWLECNDDACGTHSRISRIVPAGTYLIRVGGFQGASGTFSIELTESGTATTTAFGTGCGSTSKAFHELVPANNLDLGGLAMTLVNQGNHYVAQPGGTFVPPGANATTLQLGLDSEDTAVLSGAFPYPGGTTPFLVVCSNGFVSAGYGNGTDYTPSVSEWLDSSVARWGSWHDFNLPQGGDVKFEQVGSIAYVTWDGALSYGTNDPNTWQMQFDLATGNVTFVWDSLVPSGGEWLTGYASGTIDTNAGSTDISAQLPSTFATSSANTDPVSLVGTMPTLGSTCTLTTSELPPASAVAIQALSLTAHVQGIDLTFLGMPGCRAYTNLDAVYTMLVQGGEASYDLPIPNQANLMGFEVHAQSSVFAPTLNSFGFVNSNGLTLTLGN